MTGSAKWKLLPAEATPEMSYAGESVAMEGDPYSGYDAAEIWRAMSEAAPEFSPSALERVIYLAKLAALEFGASDDDEAAIAAIQSRGGER